MEVVSADPVMAVVEVVVVPATAAEVEAVQDQAVAATEVEVVAMAVEDTTDKK